MASKRAGILFPHGYWSCAEMVRSAWNQNAGQLTEALASAYLKEHDHSGLSAWTASRDMAAINKVLGFDLSKKELGLRQRNNT